MDVTQGTALPIALRPSISCEVQLCKYVECGLRACVCTREIRNQLAGMALPTVSIRKYTQPFRAKASLQFNLLAPSSKLPQNDPCIAERGDHYSPAFVIFHALLALHEFLVTLASRSSLTPSSLPQSRNMILHAGRLEQPQKDRESSTD